MAFPSCTWRRALADALVLLSMFALTWAAFAAALLTADTGLAPVHIDHSWAVATYALLGGAIAIPLNRAIPGAFFWHRDVVCTSVLHLGAFTIVRSIALNSTWEYHFFSNVITSIVMGVMFVLPFSILVQSVRRLLTARRSQA